MNDKLKKIFRNTPVLGILRGIRQNEIDFVSELAATEGLNALEITMNTPEAAKRIKEMIRASNGKFIVGAGTVLNIEELQEALDAGAGFIVTPSYLPEIIEYCAKNDVPVFPGALTPTEIMNAWNAGATMVKVFPAGVFGPSYFREILGPFDKISILACGGVSETTIKSYLNAGAKAAAIGGSIFRREWMEARNSNCIGSALRSILKAATEI